MRSIAILFCSLSFFVPKDKDLFSSKSIENRMVKVSTDLYANKYETTNAEYREFLEWVKSNKPGVIDQVKVQKEGWEKVLGKAYSRNYFENTGFDNYPVLNIRHEGAELFCQWLTHRYNNTKKKKFKQVKFRLPTKDEWINMASNGNKYRGYPWGGPYLKNRDGKYLAQFFKIDNQTIKIDINDRRKISMAGEFDEDSNKYARRTLFTAPVDTYIATGAGLHNLSGNAAEMLAEKGNTKGGSWGSSGYYLQIDAEDEFNGLDFSPYVGFRYVMEVVEE